MKIKRILSLFLALALTLAILPFGMFNVSAANIDDATFTSRIAELKTIFRHGEYWNNYNSCGYEGTGSKKCPSCADKYFCAAGCPDECGQFYYNGAWVSGTCLGWACKIGNLIFGGNPLAWSVHYNGNNLKPGDIIYGDIRPILDSTMHAIFITSVEGDTVTYADCNGSGPCRVRWGCTTTIQKVHTAVSDGGAKIYHASNNITTSGTSTPTPSPVYTTISNGTYYIKNNANGEYVSVAYGTDVQGQNVNTYTFNTDPEFQMVFTKTSGYGYKIRPAVCASRLVNAYGVTVTSGLNVNIWNDVNESSQWWGLEKVSGGFVIRNMMNPSCVLTRTTTSTSNREINVSTYTGDTSQIWSIQNYITYDANGGSGAPSGQLKNYDETLYLSSTKPTRSGYTFLGWSTSSSATSPSYYAGGSFTSNSNTTLYAVWAQNYTVSYNANGGSGAPSSQTKVYGQTLTLSSTVPYRSGYTFLGWSTSSSATSPSYYAGGSFTSNSNTTLYAVWRLDETPLVVNTYSYAGISTANEMKYYTYTPTTTGEYVIYSTGSSDTRVYLYDANGNQIASDDDGGEGYNFRLQYTLTAGTTYKFGLGYYGSTTGIFEFIFGYTYTISYDANGGSGAPSSQTKDHAAGLALSFTVPTRSGHTFLGWSTSPSATSPSYYAGGSFTSNSNTTLYAVWGLDETPLVVNTYCYAEISTANEMKYYTYTPTTTGEHVIYSTGSSDTRVYLYDANGNQIASDDDGGEGFNFRLQYTLTAGMTYKFELGYYDSTTGVFEFVFGYTYTISYDANGGSGAPSSQTKDHADDLTLSSTEPTRSGYDFLGWSTSASATSPSYYPGSSYTSNSNITLYAVWRKNTYTVSYNANGGTGAPSAQTKYYGTTLYLSSTKPTRTGYTFLGWSTSPSATSIAYYPGSSYTSNSNITLYAVWAKNYTISYDANGGTGQPNAQTKVSGQTLILSSTEPTRTGYTFLGWSTSSSATSPSYYAGGSFTSNSNTTLYAVWEQTISLSYEKSSDGTYYIVSEFEGTATEVVIPSSYNGLPVRAIGKSAFCFCEGLKSVTIPESVITIDDYAFEYCTALNSITIPASVTTIGERAFSDCYSLTNITIPSSIITIGDYAFYCCTDLMSITIPASVTTIGERAFSDCYSLTNVTIPASVTTISDCAFSDCDTLADIYCESTARPEGWSDSWNDSCDATVHWGYGAEAEIILGDITGDDTITATDYIVAKRAVMSTYDLTEAQIKAGDVNGDGSITATDYIILKRHVMGTYVIGG